MLQKAVIITTAGFHRLTTEKEISVSITLLLFTDFPPMNQIIRKKKEEGKELIHLQYTDFSKVHKTSW